MERKREVEAESATKATLVTEPGHLSADEIEALRYYTGVAHRPMNLALWKGSVEDVAIVSDLSHDLSSALEKFPDYEGTVFRGSEPGHSASEYNIERYEPGEIVVENGYSSSSKNPEKEFNGEIVWVIESKHGKNVAEYSSVKAEEEILFDHFSRFQVHSKEFVVDSVRGGRWLIYMHEL